jgi:hypothetical protein
MTRIGPIYADKNINHLSFFDKKTVHQSWFTGADGRFFVPFLNLISADLPLQEKNSLPFKGRGGVGLG